MKKLLSPILAAALLTHVLAPRGLAAKDAGLDILISADAIPSPEGYRPKPGKPIYYILFQSHETLGEAIGGVKLPEPAVVEKALVAELEKQGFLRAVEGGPLPDIALFAVVGDSNFKDDIPERGNPLTDGSSLGTYLEAVDVQNVLYREGLVLDVTRRYDIRDIFAPDDPDTYPSRKPDLLRMQEATLVEAIRLRNLNPARKKAAIKTLVGAEKVERAVANRTLGGVEAEKIAWATFDNQYYISVSALEAKRRPDGGRAFLWRTTMLIDWRKDFAKELTTMLAQAGPVFGTDVPVPGYVNTAKREAKVEIGETTVLPEKNSPSAPKK